ncbi:hypothetical protein V8E53_015743 [Lactarius tabidus]
MTPRIADDRGNKTNIPLYSRRTTSTALQVAVDHVFTGTYVARFRPKDPEEAAHCPCGNPLRSTQHLIYRCPRYGGYRVTSTILSYGRITHYRNLYSSAKGAHKLLTFLQESGAASKPETGPVAEVPPEPD